VAVAAVDEVLPQQIHRVAHGPAWVILNLVVQMVLLVQ
jgi:hypothetical protein